ncbi:MAG: ATP-dependent DNA helicase DinG [Porticoccaceae bacterium]
MLTADLKLGIQDSYRRFLKANGWKPRLGQRQMIAAVAGFLGGIETNAAGQRVSPVGVSAVEAGTGTGKTMAYLLAALPMAKAAGKKVVVATGTVALQAQLLERDIPDLFAATGWDYSLAIAKGRGRYLCPVRLERCRDAVAAQSAGQFLFEDEIPFRADTQSIRLFGDMAEALASGSWAGDRDAWVEAVPDATWRALTVDRRQCAGHRCRLISQCCFFRARDSLDDADCIVANHDLVMADMALGGGVILPPPEDTLYIFDEAHRLGGAALNHFAGQCRLQSTVSWLEQMQKQPAVAAENFRTDPDVVARGDSVVEMARLVTELLSESLPLFASVLERGAQRGGMQYRFPGGVVDAASLAVCRELAVVSERLRSRLERLHDALQAALDNPHYPVPKVDVEPYFQGVGQWLGRAEAVAALWLAMVGTAPAGAPPSARWLTLEDGGDIRVSVSPVTAAPVLADRLWQRCYAAVLTSATLRTLGGFDRFRADTGLPEGAPCEAVAGAFDYAKAGVLSVPANAADGGEAAAHTAAIVDGLPDLLVADEGALVLFASRYQLEEVAAKLADTLGERLLVQGRLTINEIVRRHRARIDSGLGSVIFGLASFAEGMDLPGDYCRHVIIAKLPFAVPDDPVHAALAEWIEAGGGNAFRELSLPDASLRLTQACGRLIRTETDTGRVTILDKRLLTKAYGRQLIAALPPFRREFG